MTHTSREQTASLLAADTVHDLSGGQSCPGRSKLMKGKNTQNKNFVITGSSITTEVYRKSQRGHEPPLSVLFKNGIIPALNSLDSSPTKTSLRHLSEYFRDCHHYQW